MSNYKDAAVKNGALRTLGVRTRILAAMVEIEQEIQASGGFYLANNGRLSKSELCRRAGLGKTTIFAVQHSILSDSIDEWLEKLNNISKRSSSRRNASELASAWKSRYLALSNSHHKTELDLISMKAKYDHLSNIYDDLRLENASLRAALEKFEAKVIVPIKLR
ncbi:MULTISPECIES: hypothetical protein [Pseudomonas syringae group]|nr:MULTISPECIES: hypothetical protein [Pseudomonas syringae group]UQB35472.1 hypothetical protein I9H09_18200 [Pseudomonas tremae]